MDSSLIFLTRKSKPEGDPGNPSSAELGLGSLAWPLQTEGVTVQVCVCVCVFMSVCAHTCVHLCTQELLVFTTTSSRDHWHGGASGDPNSLLRQVSGHGSLVEPQAGLPSPPGKVVPGP